MPICFVEDILALIGTAESPSMISNTRTIRFFCASLLATTTAFAQQQAHPAAAKTNATFHLDVVVDDRSGKPTAGLTEHDFTLLDNASAQSLTSFRAVTNDTSSQVIILIDAVNTPYIAVGYQRQEILKYLRMQDGVLKHPTTFAVLMDKGLQIYRKSTTNGMELADALEHYDIGLREITRSQGFWGADDRLKISINAMQQLIALESTQPGRKLVMWVSPGWPLLSGPNIELSDKDQNSLFNNAVDLSTKLRLANITLYSVNSWGVNENLERSFYYESFLKGVARPRDMQIGNLGLQVLATQSGGRVLNTSDVSGMLKQCVADADNYYELTFTPAPSDQPQQYHQLQVKLPAAGLTARTRQGYYTQP
jgi:VWFA-related protein